MKQKLFLFLVLVFSILIGSTIYADDISILVNNKEVISNTKPVIIDSTTFVPLRPVCEAMGCDVYWVESGQFANISNETTIISMQIDNTQMTRQKRTSDGKTTVLKCEKPPRIINGATYIPLRTMAEAFGAKVAWDSNTRTVMIVYDTTVKYTSNKTISVYAGHGARKRYDSSVDKMEFLSPESMDIASDGSIYISDSGAIRKIKDGKSETIEFEPDYISSAIVRCYGNNIYFTTNAFENENGEKYYGIVKLNNGVAEGIYITEAVYSKITDFDIDNNGNIYALIANVGVGKNYIARFTGSDMQFLKEIDDGFTCMSCDKNNNIYIGNSVKGSIYYYETGTNELKLFAGVDDNTRFVDGPDPMFFEPRSLYYTDNSLYVLDYNIIRRIEINGGNNAMYCESLAGKVSAELKPQTKDGKASEVEIAPSYLMEIAVLNNKVYMTDPVNDVLRIIE